MREGSLDAPTRHPIDWQDPAFYDSDAIDAELRRVFDICHGCRRCFNLCDSFPRLFELIDESETGELDSVDSRDFKAVVDACTLCDMCFMTKCPYVPPHEFNLDFPHLMLRYRAAAFKRGERSFVDRQFAETDRNGKLAGPIDGLVNWATRRGNKLSRPVLETVAHVHRDAEVPRFHGKTFEKRDRAEPVEVNPNAPAKGRKVVLYATCFTNYNNPEIGMKARNVLARNGVETRVLHRGCCGMPKLENGDLEAVAEQARTVAAAFRPLIEDEGYDVVALIPSCALMLKFEWPLILPDNEDVKMLSEATFDLSEYVVDIARKEGLADGMKPLDGDVTIHLACHARAQNMGPKGAEMLRLIPDTKVQVIERCSGHGGKWGMMKEHFETALKVGRNTARAALRNGASYTVSECPLAADHLVQVMEREDAEKAPERAFHPIELIARSYGI
ncbi:MAG: glycerol-3-phosphate dehydrogenase [Alphaproteobacteria bacterium]|nr:MAG: glycerol-3-phosphate dehydrogenase [Alphaproteobacteria bacterium]